MTSLSSQDATLYSQKRRDDMRVGCLWAGFLLATTVGMRLFSDLGYSSILTLGAATQTFGFYTLLEQAKRNKSLSGISMRTCELYMVMLTTRLCSTLCRNGYLPVDSSGDCIYQLCDIASLFFVTQLRLLFEDPKLHASYQEEHDTMNVASLVPGCLILAICIHGDLNDSFFFDTVWTLSMNIDTVAMLPQLDDYDFNTMLRWSPASDYPSPLLSQDIYGVPILSRTQRKTVLDYLNNVLDVLQDIVRSLDTDALSSTRPDADAAAAPASRRMQATGGSTQSHIEALAKSLKQLALNVGALDEPELYYRIADLMRQALNRMRLANGDITTQGEGAYDMLATLAAIYADSRPADIPRAGNIVVNVTSQVQTRLSQVVVECVELLADSLAGYLALNEMRQLSTSTPAMAAAGRPVAAAGKMSITVKVLSTDTVANQGVTMTPDYQAIDRWEFPRMTMEPLGEPGDGSNWASEETRRTVSAKYAGATCFQPNEAFLERVVVVIMAWPANPYLYSTGSLVDSKTNVTQPYSVQLRSC